MPIDDMVFAINALDNSALNLDITELLQRIVPTNEEIKLYREYQVLMSLIVMKCEVYINQLN